MRNEYPRPDFVREQWQTLNGSWDFGEGFFVEPGVKIEVPFVPQSERSKVNRILTSDQIVYERVFEVPESWKGSRILLHFGAVDYECSVWLNGNCVGSHEGGQTPFTFDITENLKGGKELLRVCVKDFLKDECVPRGKQFWQPKGEFIWYTQSSGIWQSVWLEPVAPSHIEWMRFKPDIDDGTVEITYQVSDYTPQNYDLILDISFDGTEVYHGRVSGEGKRGRLIADVFDNRAMRGSFHFTGWYWSPEQPSLFDVKAELVAGGETTDRISSYFGMRKIEVREGKVYLNNSPYYQKLVLDQGYWKESLMTAPSEEAFIDDIRKMKAMGFNGCRKHEKVEDPVFLYWADRLGFLVWESMSSFWSFTPQYAAAFSAEWSRVILRDYSHPCIVVWNMLNESWGVPGLYDNRMRQHYARSLYHLARGLDDTRLVIANDGWELTENDICAFHTYKHGDKAHPQQQEKFRQGLQSLEGLKELVEKPLFAKGFSYGGQPVMLTEIGGMSLGSSRDTNGDGDSWGYTDAANEAEYLEDYEKLIDSIYASDLICGFCYTQLSDIEQEKNGLLDERHQFKIDAGKIKLVNDKKGCPSAFFVSSKNSLSDC